MEQFALRNRQLKQLMQYKKFFHGNEETVYLLIKKDRDGKEIAQELYGSLASNRDEIVKKNKVGFNAYMLTNSTGTGTRRADDITKINGASIDFDGGNWTIENVKKFLRKFPVKPGLVVETSPGNFHVYWRIKDMPLDKFKKLQQMLAAKFGADPSVCDLPRVMRMPGTFNWNHDPAFLARTVYINKSQKPLGWVEFAQRMFGEDEAKMLIDGSGVGSVRTSLRTVTPKEKKGEQAEEADRLLNRVKGALACISSDRRDVWITVAMALKNGLGEEGLEPFKDWSKTSSKYDEIELIRQWKSLRADGGIKIRTLFWLAAQYLAIPSLNAERRIVPSTQLEIVKLFARRASHLLRHSEGDNAWYCTEFGRWRKSRKKAEQVVINFLSALRTDAAESGNPKYQELVEKFQSAGSAREILRAAESDPGLSISSDIFDQAPNILNVQFRQIPATITRYGVITLDEHKRRYAKPEDMVLKVAGAEYDPDAKCPLWKKFVSDAMGGDNELVKFLQLAVGYTLYGHAKEQAMFILIGDAGNGKGVFARTIFAMLGEYAATLQHTLLKPGAINANQPSPALMKLKGKRLWACSEVPKGMVLDEALVKQLTGGDMITGRHLYGEQQEFLPIGKLWLTVNDMPRVRHDDKGMWRRIIPIPFGVRFSGTSRDDKDLEGKLKAELPGIMQWALRGARKYAELGKLPRPKVVRDFIRKLRGNVDTVGNWVDHACRVGDDLRLQAQNAYDSYLQYMRGEKSGVLNQREFKGEMVRQGYAHRASNRFNYFDGISLRGE